MISNNTNPNAKPWATISKNNQQVQMIITGSSKSVLLLTFDQRKFIQLCCERWYAQCCSWRWYDPFTLGSMDPSSRPLHMTAALVITRTNKVPSSVAEAHVLIGIPKCRLGLLISTTERLQWWVLVKHLSAVCGKSLNISLTAGNISEKHYLLVLCLTVGSAWWDSHMGLPSKISWGNSPDFLFTLLLTYTSLGDVTHPDILGQSLHNFLPTVF